MRQEAGDRRQEAQQPRASSHQPAVFAAFAAAFAAYSQHSQHSFAAPVPARGRRRGTRRGRGTTHVDILSKMYLPGDWRL